MLPDLLRIVFLPLITRLRPRKWKDCNVKQAPGKTQHTLKAPANNIGHIFS